MARSARVRTLRWVRLAVAGALLLVASITGGVAATALFPTPTETANYRATLALSLDPADRSHIRVPTVFGDISIAFAAPLSAPGVRADVQVKEQITQVLASPTVSVAALQPTPQEISEAVRAAIVGMAWRFGAGSLLVVVAVVGGWWLWRRRRPRAVVLAGATAVWLVACGAAGGLTATTYQPSRYAEYRATSVLGTISDNSAILGDVEARARQTAPYLKNLLALSTALQERYQPQELDQPVAARILLVSDIHGANQYALMRTIIEREQVDAVLDTGDLVNLGSVAEGDAAGLFAGIRSLGVPYLFVDGNHDASSATDTALLQRLGQIPNVVLLQPNSRDYTVADVHGIRIGGFNDPRWFGDDNRDNAAKQAPAAEAFTAAFADVPRLDLVAAHEPAAVEGVDDADLRVHGHMHSPSLEGNVIGVGTFTGGGPLSHFIAEEADDTGESDGGELRGQPNSFDIATFGATCQLTQLARYTYRDVIEGRPAYDDVSLLNGSRIEEAGPQPDPTTSSTATATSTPGAATTTRGVDPDTGDRVCGAELGIDRETVPAAETVADSSGD